MDAYAPITPDQEQAIRAIAATRNRHEADRILDGLLQLDVERAADRLRRLRGEPAAPVAVVPPTDPAATRAYNAEMRETLRAGYAGRAMQPVGLGQTSLFAGYSGHSPTTTR